MYLLIVGFIRFVMRFAYAPHMRNMNYIDKVLRISTVFHYH